jgi:hypothetical protein
LGLRSDSGDHLLRIGTVTKGSPGLETLWWLVTQIVWIAWGVLSWVAAQLLWLVLWILLPVIAIGVVGLRIAEHFIGNEKLRSWVRMHSLRFGTATWHRARRALFALGALPLRVMAWLIFYTLWHSVISWWWTPRWDPLKRAWNRRWRSKRPA